MKKEIRIICKAYENWDGTQIKKEIADCESEKAAIAYAGNFLSTLKAENAVMIRFINEDAGVEYLIDADEIEKANEKIAIMASAYEETVSRENLVKFEVGTTCRSFNENGDVADYKIKARTAKMVTLEGKFGDENHKKISVDDIGEYVKLTKGIFLSAKSVVDVEKENALMRICEVVSEGMTLYEQVKADDVVLETIYKMVKEYYAKAISDIKATENLLASGVIKAEELRTDSKIYVDFEVIDNGYEKDAYAAGLIIRGAKLEENEFDYSNCKNLNYLGLTISAIKKAVELFLDKDASELDVEFKTSEESAVSVIAIPKEIEMTVEPVPFAIERFNEGAVEETEMNAEIAAMEKEVERKKRLVEYKTTVTFPQRLKSFSERIVSLYAQIAEIENEMWDYQLYAEELTKEYEGEIAALEAEIFNRKMIEAQEYINVSEEAFKISVQAEIDAANNVKAIENLMQAALNTAVTEVEPVTFAIERFNEGVEEEAAELVDTSVAEVPTVDAYAEIEDEIKCKLEAIEGLKLEVKALREQLKDIKKKDAPVDEESALFEEYKTLDAEVDEFYRKFFFKRGALNETRRKLTDVLKKKFEPYVYLFNGLVEKASNNDAEIILHSQDGKGYDIAEGNWEEFDIYLDFANSPKYVITYRLLRIAEYQTLDAIKAAIEGLAAAIERGDEEFAFPAEEKA